MKAENNSQFRNLVDGWLSELITEVGANWSLLLHRLPGVYPTEVIAGIRRLKQKGVISTHEHSGIVADSRLDELELSRPSNELPADYYAEHPLDFEWHFDCIGKQRMLDAAVGFAGIQQKILCIGCPSVFYFAKGQGCPRNIVLWDKNSDNIAEEGSYKIDLTCDALPNVCADVVVIDPPWYNDYYALFLWAASNAVCLNGRVLVSFPQKGTRPTAGDDLHKVVLLAQQMGLQLQENRIAELPYRAPFFEMNALRAADVTNVPIDWRKGNMLVFQKRNNSNNVRPHSGIFNSNWVERRVDNVRVKISTRITLATNRPTIRPASREAIIPSVSTRFEGRQNANVVTSGNRYFVTDSPELLISLCENGPNGVQNDGFAELRSQWKRILSKEQRELSAYFKKYNDQ